MQKAFALFNFLLVLFFLENPPSSCVSACKHSKEADQADEEYSDGEEDSAEDEEEEKTVEEKTIEENEEILEKLTDVMRKKRVRQLSMEIRMKREKEEKEKGKYDDEREEESLDNIKTELETLQLEEMNYKRKRLAIAQAELKKQIERAQRMSELNGQTAELGNMMDPVHESKSLLPYQGVGPDIRASIQNDKLLNQQHHYHLMALKNMADKSITDLAENTAKTFQEGHVEQGRESLGELMSNLSGAANRKNRNGSPSSGGMTFLHGASG